MSTVLAFRNPRAIDPIQNLCESLLNLEEELSTGNLTVANAKEVTDALKSLKIALQDSNRTYVITFGRLIIDVTD